MENYFIKAPKNKKLKDLQISFLKNASKKYSLRQDQLKEELEFLQHQFILVKDKIYKNSNETEKGKTAITDVYIFNVSSGQLLYDSTKDKQRDIPFEDLQVGFFIQAQAEGDSKDSVTHFSIKCLRNDFQIHFTKQGPEVLHERCQAYLRYSQHMIMP